MDKEEFRLSEEKAFLMKLREVCVDSMKKLKDQLALYVNKPELFETIQDLIDERQKEIKSTDRKIKQIERASEP